MDGCKLKQRCVYFLLLFCHIKSKRPLMRPQNLQGNNHCKMECGAHFCCDSLRVDPKPVHVIDRLFQGREQHSLVCIEHLNAPASLFYACLGRFFGIQQLFYVILRFLYGELAVYDGVQRFYL